jgi:imidazolonepropionase-like amidohydrolase
MTIDLLSTQYIQMKLFRIIYSLSLALLGPVVALAQIAIKGETVYTMAGQPLKNGVVLVKDSKIEAVGTNLRIPAGYQIHTAKVVTPGLVDAHTTLGLAGALNVDVVQDQLEKSNAVQPELRALDAYNPNDPLVAYARSLGVTTVHTGHGPGALISGQTMVTKTSGKTVGPALLDTTTMIAITLTDAVRANFKTPGTRAKSVSMLRTELMAAQEYRRKMVNADPSKRPATSLKLDYLSGLLSGRYKALISAHKATDISSALRLAREFGLSMVLDGGAEAYLLLDEIKAAGIPVIIHPTMMRAGGDTKNASMETAATLAKAGIPLAIQSGFEGYVPRTRVILFEAGIAASNGLPFEQALAAITINAARIIGQDKRVGSLEKGKDADIVLFDGDPFEYTTHVCKVMIDGKIESDGCK